MNGKDCLYQCWKLCVNFVFSQSYRFLSGILEGVALCSASVNFSILGVDSFPLNLRS